MKLTRYVLPIIYCTLLSSCGGGSSNNDSPAPVDDDETQLGLDSRPNNTSCIAPDTPGELDATFALNTAFPDLPPLNSPLGLYQLPGDNDWFYAIERGGTIRRFAHDPDVSNSSLALDISDVVNSLGSEGGLLGFAFHPEVTTNRAVYLSYTTTSPNRSVISRFTFSNDFLTIDRASERVLLELEQPAGNHNGGNIEFGPDGNLYIAFGDGGTSFRARSQETDNFYGTMLRIAVDPVTTTPPYYSVPNDNPFVGDSNFLPEIFAYGFRNPWRWSFDKLTGDLWLADVGAGSYEEVNRVDGGENFGWPIMEGMHCVNSGCDESAYTLPVTEYDHSNGNCSITGGFVYRGDTIAGLDGRFVYADYCSAQVWSVFNNNGTAIVDSLTTAPSFVPAMAQDNRGEIYLLLNNSSIVQLQGPSENSSNIPTRLSETGCFQSNNPATPSDALIPYSVIAPLWSDGADKERFFAIPDGESISINSELDFEFPVGSILAKHFSNNNTLIETRLLMHHSSGWAGYSYEWNAAQSDATLLEGAKDEMVAGLMWHFPSGQECRICHTQQKEFTLGPELQQLNHDFIYPSTGRTGNQIDTLIHIGLLTNSPPTAPADSSLFALNDSAASLEQRAKSYLNSNCSQCHSPGGIGAGTMDLRFNTSLEAMNICNVDPLDNLGISDAKLLAPGNPNLSAIIERMQRLDVSRMPPLASNVVDEDAVIVISDWISSVVNCP